MDKGKALVGQFDARIWATEFNKMLVSKNIQPLDPGLLLGWFANAIMAGYDHRAKTEITTSEVEQSLDKFTYHSHKEKQPRIIWTKETRDLIATALDKEFIVIRRG